MGADKPCPHVNVQPASMFPPAPPFFLPCGPQAGEMMIPLCDQSLIPPPRQCGPCILLNVPQKCKIPHGKQGETEKDGRKPKKESSEKNRSKAKKKRHPSAHSSSSSTSTESIGDKGKQKTGKKRKARGLRSKSRELRAGILYSGCDCEKRNGLQDDCRRTECQGSPACKTVPPSCGPSEFSNAKHLVKKQEKWLKAHPNKVVKEKFFN